MTFHLSPQSAEYWRQWVSGLGALVCGRTLFDVTDGWGGRHTMDVPVVVVTHEVPTAWVEAHPDAPFHFVTDGVEAAVAKAQEIAGDRIVAVAAGTIARQCLELGLLDEVAVDLVPVVMGRGRPFFGKLPSRTSRSATRRSASRETGSPTWCSPRSGRTTLGCADCGAWSTRRACRLPERRGVIGDPLAERPSRSEDVGHG